METLILIMAISIMAAPIGLAIISCEMLCQFIYSILKAVLWATNTSTLQEQVERV